MSEPQRKLNLLDVVCINVGIIIGAGIYESPPFVASNTSGPMVLLALWVLGGLAAFLGSICYAELTSAYPRQGGEYVFLREAYGGGVGFLFAWADLWIIRPGNIGTMAFVFANYAHQLLELKATRVSTLVAATLPIGILTLTNLLGVQSGKWTQNGLTIIKIFGLAAIIVTALVLLPPAEGGGLFDPPSATNSDGSSSGSSAAPSVAMIVIMFIYGGWNEMSNVAAEMRDPQRTIVRGLVCSALTVAGIYVAANWAFLRVLGFEGLVKADAVAANVMEMRFGGAGRVLISALICISSLGAINGMLFTGPRIYYALGCNHRSLAWIGHWNSRWSVPARAIVLLSVVTVGMVSAFGIYEDGFTRLVNFTSPVFWLFFLMVGLAIFPLRRRSRDDNRDSSTFRVPGGPVIPALFCLISAGMCYAGVDYAIRMRSVEGLWSICVLALGLAIVVVRRLQVGRGGQSVGPSGR